MASSDLLLHPVRLRIIQVLLGDRVLTTQQIAAELEDVSTATIYRHVAVLHQAGVLAVAGERKVRGVIERSYHLRVDATHLDPDQVARLTPEEHARMFRTFIAVLLGDFDRYLESGAPVLGPGGVGYSMAGLSLSDSEFASFLRDLQGVFARYAAPAPGEDRRRRIFATITMPAPESSATAPDDEPASSAG